MNKQWLVFMVILILSLFVLPTRAQETTAEPAAVESPPAEITQEAPAAEPPNVTEDAPTGLSTLMLLMGLGAVSVVGLAMLARDNLQNQSNDKR